MTSNQHKCDWCGRTFDSLRHGLCQECEGDPRRGNLVHPRHKDKGLSGRIGDGLRELNPWEWAKP